MPWAGVSASREAVLHDLLMRCAADDRLALATFYDRTSPWIGHLVRNRTNSAQDADDAIMDIYATVWRRAGEYAAANRTALAWATSITFEIVGPSRQVAS